MIVNGKQSIYQEFHDWHMNNKVQAEYDAALFVQLFHDKIMSKFEAHVFFSNYELWLYCKCNSDAIDTFRRMRAGDDED